jgi:hypothetical protein
LEAQRLQLRAVLHLSTSIYECTETLQTYRSSRKELPRLSSFKSFAATLL